MLRRIDDDQLERYPLRQPLSPGAGGLAIFARRGPVEWLSRPGSYLVVCEGQTSARLYAANERALNEAWEEIAAAHGSAVVVGGEPQVHESRDAALGLRAEPLMFVRLKVPRGYAAAVVDDLERRGARLLEKNLRGLQAVIRAEARLADLLGYEDAVQALTHRAATLWIWLLRYEPVRTSSRDGGPTQRLEPRQDEEEAHDLQ